MRSILTVSAVVLIASLSLSGCAVVENAIEGATGGEVTLGGQSIPEGFPTDDVPVISGDILLGSSGSKDDRTVYNVVVKVETLDSFGDI